MINFVLPTRSYVITNGQLASLWVPWPTLALLITLTVTDHCMYINWLQHSQFF